MDMRDLDLNLLRALDALLAGQNVTLAAQRLGLSQPATSAALARLRVALGDPLLVRRGNRMMLTARAEELKPRVSAVLDSVLEVFSQPMVFEASTSNRHLRVLVNDFAAVVLTRMAVYLRTHAPGIILEILPFDRNFEERFASRDVDYVLSDSISLAGYRYSRQLAKDHYVSLVRSDHPRLAKGTVSLDQFLAEKHALVSTKGYIPGVVDKALASLDRKRHVVVTVPHFFSLPHLLHGTDLVSTVPGRIARELEAGGGLRSFPPPMKVAPFDVLLAWPARSAFDPVTSWFSEVLGELMPGPREDAW